MMKQSQAGFSLLELLVAMTVLGFLGSAMAAGVRFGLNVWTDGGAATQRAQQGRYVAHLWRTQLSALEKRSLRGTGRERVAAFWGEPDRLSFVGALPDSAYPKRSQLLTYERSAVGQLELHWRRFDPELLFQTQDERQLVLDGVEALSFQYYGRIRPGGPKLWQDRWVNRANPPSMIRIDLETDASIPPIFVTVETQDVDL